MSDNPDTDFRIIAIDTTYAEGRKVLDDWLGDNSKQYAKTQGKRYVAGITYPGWEQSACIVTNELQEVIGFIMTMVKTAQATTRAEYFRFRLQGLRPEAAAHVNAALALRNAEALAQRVGGHA